MKFKKGDEVTYTNDSVTPSRIGHNGVVTRTEMIDGKNAYILDSDETFFEFKLELTDNLVFNESFEEHLLKEENFQ